MNKIWYPNQRVIRTAIQVVFAVSSGIALFLVIAPQVLEAIREFLPDSWYFWLLGLIAFVGTVSAALSKIMTIPQVDEWLKKFGAGTAPANPVVFWDVEQNGLHGVTRREYRKRTGI